MWIKNFFLGLQKELVFHVVMARAADLRDRRNIEHKMETINFKSISTETIRIAGEIIELFLYNDRVHYLCIYKQAHGPERYSFFIERGVGAKEYDNMRYALNDGEWSEDGLIYVLKKAGLNVNSKKIVYNEKIIREIEVRC